MIRSAVFFSLVFTCSYTFAVDEKITIGDYVGTSFSDDSGVLVHKLGHEVVGDEWNFVLKIGDLPYAHIRRHARIEAIIDKQKIASRLSTNVSLLIYLPQEGAEMLCVEGYEYVEEKSALRIDTNLPIETDGKGCLTLTSELDLMLRKGNIITLPGFHFHNHETERQKISLDGYAEVVDFVRAKRDAKPKREE